MKLEDMIIPDWLSRKPDENLNNNQSKRNPKSLKQIA